MVSLLRGNFCEMGVVTDPTWLSWISIMVTILYLFYVSQEGFSPLYSEVAEIIRIGVQVLKIQGVATYGKVVF